MNSTIPAPFHKYLYSGARYIQIGHCFSVVNRSIHGGFDLRDDLEVDREITALWNNFVAAQSLAWKNSVSEHSVSPLSVQLEQIDILCDEMTNMGEKAKNILIEALQETDLHDMDLDTFFRIWASTCAQSYAEFIRSDTVSKALASTVNSMLEGSSQD